MIPQARALSRMIVFLNARVFLLQKGRKMEVICTVLIIICLALAGAVCYLCFKVKRLQRRIDGLAVFVEMARNYANKDSRFIPAQQDQQL